MQSPMFELPQGRVFGFDSDANSTVWCLGGEVWVTGPGLGDRVLSPGQAARIAARGRVVVQALSPARVRISAAAA